MHASGLHILESRISPKIAKTHIIPYGEKSYHPYHTQRDPYHIRITTYTGLHIFKDYIVECLVVNVS